MSLTAFVTGALLIGPAEWAEICPRAVAATTTLAHLRDLLLLVEVKGIGCSPTDAVAACYRQLPRRQKNEEEQEREEQGE